MSELVGGIHYTVDLDTGGLIAGQRKVNQSLASMGDAGDRLSSKMSGVGIAITSMFAAGAIIAQFAKAAHGAKLFEAAIDNLSAITGATGNDLKYLENAAKEFGNTTSASALQTVEAMKLIASAKPELLSNAAALKEVTAQAVILADASGMTLPQAAESLTLALNQMGVGADQAGRFINVMAAGAKFGASEISQSSDALKQFAVSARGVGLSIEEANAGIQALAAVGIKGAEAGTGLRNVLLKLENETDQKLKPSINGLSGALENLGKKNLDSASLTKMFGLENINTANALIGSTDQIRLLTTQLTGTDTALEQANINTDNYAGSIKRMQNALESAYIEIGTKFNPILKEGADLITNLAVEVSEGSNRIDIAMTAMSTAAVVAAGSLSGPLVVGLYASVRAMTAATVAARVFTGVMAVLGGPVGIAITALGLLALNWDKIAGKAKTAAEVSEDAADRIAKAQGKSAAKATKDLQEQLEEAKKGLADTEVKLADNSKRSIYGGTVGPTKDIEELKKRRDAYVSYINDINSAINSFGGMGGRGKVNPDLVTPAAEVKPKGVSTEKKDKFNDASYLAGLKKNTVDAYGAIDAIEQKALIDNDSKLEAKQISYKTHQQAILLIAQAASKDRQDLMTKELRDFQDKALQADEFIAEQSAKADERDKRRQNEKTNARIDILRTKAQSGGLQDQENLVRGMGQADMAAVEAQRVEAARILDLEGMQIYADQKVAIEGEMNAKIQSMRESANQSAMNSTADIFGSLVSITKDAAGEQSAAYKIAFAAQKAYSIASAIVAIQTGIAAASANPWPMNLAAMASVAAATASIVSTISGTSVAGGRQYGGPVSAGSMYRVNETGAPEMFTGSNGQQYLMPTKSGQVTPADSVGGGKQPWIINIQNAPVGTTTSVNDQERTISIAVGEVAGQIRSNSGPVWSALRGSSNVQGRM